MAQDSAHDLGHLLGAESARSFVVLDTPRVETPTVSGCAEIIRTCNRTFLWNVALFVQCFLKIHVPLGMDRKVRRSVMFRIKVNIASTKSVTFLDKTVTFLDEDRQVSGLLLSVLSVSLLLCREPAGTCIFSCPT